MYENIELFIFVKYYIEEFTYYLFIIILHFYYLFVLHEINYLNILLIDIVKYSIYSI